MSSILVVFVSLSLFNAPMSQRKFQFNTSSGLGGELQGSGHIAFCDITI